MEEKPIEEGIQKPEITSKDLAQIASKTLKESFSRYKTVAKSSSRGDVVKGVEAAFLDADVSKGKDNVRVMAECLIDMYNSAILIQGHLLETEQTKEGE